ncbi:MAG TPA: type II toxin-antitoxin system PemK/MazF family toxin, partial [Polyangiaceae bacterium]|nr:type II toxin-antitoxin system PemK/MazF family toxin [Polyangiaceae bacterium]
AVVSREDLIESAFSTVICAPVYTARRGLSTEVHIGTAEGLRHDSAILCDALVSLEKKRLTQYVGCLGHDKLLQLATALRIALDVEADEE